MGKKSFNQKLIRDDILLNFVEDTDDDLITTEEILKHLNLLVDNMKAAVIACRDDTYSPTSAIALKYTCKYMCSLNKDIKRYITKSTGHQMLSNIAYVPKEYEELSSYLLHPGIYYATEKKENSNKYLVLYIKNAENEDEYIFDWVLYFVGKKCIERKNKFYDDVKKFNDNLPISGIDKITYLDGRPSIEAIFKTFDQMVFENKSEIVGYIDNWKRNIPKYNKYGIIPKLSILLYGDPGVGKSTFCKALAKYLGIHTIKSLSPQYFDIDSNNKGRSISVYSDECVYSIDDIDTVCQSREGDSSKDNNKIISTLLDFLDAPPSFYYKANDGKYYLVSIVVATTNYIDKLDKAVKRSGRFDLKIEMKNFTRKQAQEMCDLYNLKLEDIYKKEITDDTEFVPAEIEALCTENIDKEFKHNIKS